MQYIKRKQEGLERCPNQAKSNLLFHVPTLQVVLSPDLKCKYKGPAKWRFDLQVQNRLKQNYMRNHDVSDR